LVWTFKIFFLRKPTLKITHGMRKIRGSNLCSLNVISSTKQCNVDRCTQYEMYRRS